MEWPFANLKKIENLCFMESVERVLKPELTQFLTIGNQVFILEEGSGRRKSAHAESLVKKMLGREGYFKNDSGAQ
jgi:hypothetical protein